MCMDYRLRCQQTPDRAFQERIVVRFAPGPVPNAYFCEQMNNA